jgi:hypothetical protein
MATVFCIDVNVSRETFGISFSTRDIDHLSVDIDLIQSGDDPEPLRSESSANIYMRQERRLAFRPVHPRY